MRFIINFVVSIATIFQFFVSGFNILTMKQPETLVDSLYNDLVLLGCLCAFMVGFVFILIYNFRYSFLDNRIINFSFFVIVLFASYVHIYQIFVQKDLILISGVLILVDFFVGRRGIKMMNNQNKQ